MKIFVLEDDEAIGIGLLYTLQNEKFDVTLAKTVKNAYEILEKTALTFVFLI